MDDQSFRILLAYVGGDWAGYRKVRKGVKKRISRHMQGLGCRTMADYLAAVDADSALRRECERLMTVAVSRFFRDRGLWDRLRVVLFEGGGRRQRAAIRVWSAGCAGGEEVYSLKILEAQDRQAEGRSPVLAVLATDKNPENLKRARQGKYPASSLKELPPDIVASCFESKKGGRRFAVLPHLFENIEWRRHDLLETPPEGMFSAIFLRNSLLTYYLEKMRKKTLATILARLEPGGILVVGSHEQLPEGFAYMERDPLCPHIYRRKQPVADPLSC